MKRMILFFTLFALSTPVAYADFDFTITDSTPYEYGVIYLNNQSLLVTGSGASSIEVRDASILDVRNTSPLSSSGGITDILLADTSQLLYTGGETDLLSIGNNATAVISGGTINMIRSYQLTSVTKHITFICDVDSVNYTGNLLTGNWLDGTSFSVTLIDKAPYDSVYSNIEFIPEPATLMLLGLGGLLMRRRK